MIVNHTLHADHKICTRLATSIDQAVPPLIELSLNGAVTNTAFGLGVRVELSASDALNLIATLQRLVEAHDEERQRQAQPPHPAKRRAMPAQSPYVRPLVDVPDLVLAERIVRYAAELEVRARLRESGAYQQVGAAVDETLSKAGL